MRAGMEEEDQDHRTAELLRHVEALVGVKDRGSERRRLRVLVLIFFQRRQPQGLAQTGLDANDT